MTAMDISKEHGFDAARLASYLRSTIEGLGGPMTLERISGGQSNPTFFVTFANRRLVLRKKPAGPLLPSAHAIDREYRVMHALAGTGVPVPEVICFCPDAQIIGTPFYVMGRLEGRVFSDPCLPGVAPKERRAMYLAMAETLARLHHVDWQSAGLGDFGKAGGYFQRQMTRFTRQWQMSKTRDLPQLQELSAWLMNHIPERDVTAISHGDFRIGNLMFHPTLPRVIGVLDWELATLGDPMADLAYSTLAWHLAHDEYMGILGADQDVSGIPSQAQYVDHYFSHSAAAGQLQPFHVAFSLFRLAVMFEGVSARAAAGTAASANAAQVGRLGLVFASRGLAVIAGATTS